MISKHQALKIISSNSNHKCSKTTSNLIHSLQFIGKKYGSNTIKILPNHLRKNNHSIISLDNGTSISITGNGKLAENSKYKWQKYGIMKDGICTTVKRPESPKNPRCEILSDVLEHHVPEKYYIDNQTLKKILKH